MMTQRVPVGSGYCAFGGRRRVIIAFTGAMRLRVDLLFGQAIRHVPHTSPPWPLAVLEVHPLLRSPLSQPGSRDGSC